MTETIELRVRERNVHLVFDKHEGERLSDLVRRIEIRADDIRIPRIRELAEELEKTKDDFLFFTSSIKRTYTKSELDAAEICSMWITRIFDSYGEDYGTVYDDSVACPACGAGGKQLSELFLLPSVVPRTKDAASSGAVERVVSSRFHSVVQANTLTGVDLPLIQPPLRGVRGKAAKVDPATWFQLVVSSKPVDVVFPTRFGRIPFWEQEVKCPFGHYTDLWVLSEASVARSTWDGADIFQSHQQFGVRRGSLRPYPIMFVTQRVRRIFEAAKLKGLKFEVAHFV